MRKRGMRKRKKRRRRKMMTTWKRKRNGKSKDKKTSSLIYLSWCVPGLDQACKRILPPLPGQGQYSLWCWRGSLACPRPKMGCWGRIIICVVLCFFVLYCTLNEGIKHSQMHICCVYHVKSFSTLITSFYSIVLNWPRQCVKLCCSVCGFEGLCVMSGSKVCFSKIELFWVESFILTWT